MVEFGNFLIRNTYPNRIYSGVMFAVKILHENNAIKDPITGRKISIGLVRVGNISTAIRTARFLSRNLSKNSNEMISSKVACYHSQLFPIHRWFLEKRLDELLSRKNGNVHIFKDPEIRQLLDDGQSSDIIFVVVATPVEEIGRDHDFDWGVIEPSSAQSIVQVSGRINRHRLIDVKKPNIAILQYNSRHLRKEKLAFRYPGLEFERYPSHDISELLNMKELESNQIDARLRFNTENHPFSKQDDLSIEKETKKYFSSMTGESDCLWMGQDLYRETSLRNRSPRIEMKLIDCSDPQEFLCKLEGSKDAESSRIIELSDLSPKSSTWLSPSDYELEQFARDAGVDRDKALTVSVLSSDIVKIKRDLSFGFFYNPSK